MSEAEMQQETRRQKAFERLGTDNPICVCCGETDWRCMELHHVEGKDHGKTLVCVCRNCHRKLSHMQKDHTQSARLGKPPTNIESIGKLLQGLADFLIMLAEKLWEYGAYLIEQASAPKPKVKPVRP
ncbi:MAG: HNH endonuclease [Alphaproteobacteria bacterium]|nr:HNH endonuclease [Alphaproteobacteria bacterium]